MNESVPEAVSSRDLAAALAARLDAVAPAGLRVIANGPEVTVYREDRVVGGSSASSILDESSDERHVETAGRSTISGIQDVFAEELTEPWPAAVGEMPVLGVRVTGGVLRAWFGPEGSPVVSLAPFALSSS